MAGGCRSHQESARVDSGKFMGGEAEAGLVVGRERLLEIQSICVKGKGQTGRLKGDGQEFIGPALPFFLESRCP